MPVGKARAATAKGAGELHGFVVPCFTTIDEASVKDHLERDHFFWLDLTSPDSADIAKLGRLFGFHPLALEDIEQFQQRPKLDNYGEYVFLVFYGAWRHHEADPEPLREVHLFVSGQYVKVVTPQRDMFARSVDQVVELPGLELDERDYFRDIYDHLIRISDLIDSYRDLLSGATDLYLSTVSNRQNDVMKQLTVIATIFLPLAFITGFFGQNFGFMVRDIAGGWAFWVLGVGSMVATVVGLLIFFHRKGWV
jgi:Mg2+ and Co2+ transporter CorA